MTRQRCRGPAWFRRSVVVGCCLAGLAIGCAQPVDLASAFGEPLRAYQGARLYKTGTEALDAGDLDRAVADLEAASGLAPLASEIQNHLGLAYWARGESLRAQLAFERSLQIDCENTAAEHNLAALEASMSKPEAAREAARLHGRDRER